MRKILIVVCLLLVVMGCGGGGGAEGNCCDDHGGGGVCMKDLTYIHGYLEWGETGHTTCNDKLTDGSNNNYQCPDVCK